MLDSQLNNSYFSFFLPSNKFGHIARVESAALFRTESASSLALSRATESVADADDIDGDFF